MEVGVRLGDGLYSRRGCDELGVALGVEAWATACWHGQRTGWLLRWEGLGQGEAITATCERDGLHAWQLRGCTFQRSLTAERGSWR